MTATQGTTAVARVEFAGLQRVEEVREAIATNFGDGGLSPMDLDRVRIPAGGATTWDIPSIEGSTEAKEIQGVIVYAHAARSYWAQGMEESTGHSPPDCSSPDGIRGYGAPGGECAACPLNQFGSGKKGSGKACKEIKALYMLQEENLMPVLVPVPPSSLKPVKQFFAGLTTKGIAYRHAVVGISLKKVPNGQGIQYAQAQFRFIRRLEAPEKAAADAYGKQFAQFISAAALRQAQSGGLGDVVDSGTDD